MEALKGSPRLMIVSDLDNTMVDHQDPENISLLRFDALWEADYRHDSLLVFSTGRSPTLYKKLRREKPLLTPNITIMSVGTEITYGDSLIPDKGWEEWVNQGWNRGIVVEEASKIPHLKFQAETEQRAHKVSFYIEKTNAPEVIDTLSKRLEECQLDVKIIYSGGIDLDILPKGAGKGQALAYLLKKFNSEGRSPLNTLVCGDSGNDAELFSVADVYGVMVSNAQEELLQWYEENAKGNSRIIHASERCAAGIIQAMKHFNLEPNVSPRDVVGHAQAGPAYFAIGHEIVEFYLISERWRRAEVEDSDDLFQKLKSVIDPNCSLIHPWGVEENLFTSIDVLRKCYGDQKGKRFRIWIDRIHPLKIASDTWLVTFDKWELIEQERRCCITTAVMKAKPDAPNRLLWLHIHETWLDGYGSSVNLCCSI
uniref:Sucrose-phosphatase n=1 Tax=Ginkgo biloba TaxID=3311 RepID=Q2XP31_GINBI|nr:sucrose-phosphatase 1 [Ginkgo biloba]